MEPITSKQCKQNQKIIVLTMEKKLNSVRDEIIEKINILPEKFDERYASKLSEKIVYGTVGTVITLVVTALVYFVIRR